MRDAILANCATMVIFKTGVKDAETLEPALYPFDKKLILWQSNYHAVTKTSQDGKVELFTMETLPSSPTERDSASVNVIVEESRRRYGRKREEVEREVFQRFGWDRNDERAQVGEGTKEKS